MSIMNRERGQDHPDAYGAAEDERDDGTVVVTIYPEAVQERLLVTQWISSDVTIPESDWQ